jgi:hypothetical protein
MDDSPSRERLLEADLGQTMADDVKLAAAERACAAKVTKAKGKVGTTVAMPAGKNYGATPCGEHNS